LIESDCAKYAIEGEILILGDLIARTNAELDFIMGDDKAVFIPLSSDYSSDITQRKSQDLRNTCSRGKAVLELCISAQLRILNGRAFGDSLGKYTCRSPVGSSVIDYGIVSENLLSSILYFSISDLRRSLSDHCK
jgi:hypothetical protein